jgi:hypothetical protein
MGDAFFLGSGILTPDSDGFNVVDTMARPEDCAQRVFGCAQEMIWVASQVRTDFRQVRQFTIIVGDVWWDTHCL